MNLRVFKKDIEFFIGEFIEDCELFILLNPHKDSEKIDQIIEEAVDLYNDLKQKAAHPEGSKATKQDSTTELLKSPQTASTPWTWLLTAKPTPSA